MSDLIRILGTPDLWLIILSYAAPSRNNSNEERHRIKRSYIEFCTISISVLAAIFSPFKLEGSLLTTGEPNWIWSTIITVTTVSLSIYLEDKYEQKSESWLAILLLVLVKVTCLLQLVKPKKDSGIFGFFFGLVLGLTYSRNGLFKAKNYLIYIFCVLLLGGSCWLEENGNNGGKYRKRNGRWRPYNLVLTIWCALAFAIYSSDPSSHREETYADHHHENCNLASSSTLNFRGEKDSFPRRYGAN